MESLELLTKVRVYSLIECSNEKKDLIEKAKNSSNSAYAPYSGFHVGAAVLLEDGTIVTGSNQENAAYPSGLCAERTALFYANAHYPDLAVKAIAGLENSTVSTLTATVALVAATIAVFSAASALFFLRTVTIAYKEAPMIKTVSSILIYFFIFDLVYECR